MGVGDRDEQIGVVEGDVVVAAVPHDDVAAVRDRPRRTHDRLVVVARVDDVAAHDVGLVLLHLLDRALVALEVGHLGEALHLLTGEIAVRHRVPDRDDLEALRHEHLDDLAGGLALPGAGTDGADGDDRLRARDLGVGRAEQRERGTGRHDDRAHPHHVLVRDVAVGERTLVDLELVG